MKDFLSETDREDLRIRHRKERDRRVADRIKAVLLLDEGWRYRAIAEALLLDEETISQHLKDYLEEERLKPANGGSKGKLNTGHCAIPSAALQSEFEPHRTCMESDE